MTSEVFLAILPEDVRGITKIMNKLIEKKILVALTGGGTAGHVIPHLALLPEFRKKGWDVTYIGSNSIEKELAINAGLDFYEISAGKLRRYISFRNFFDLFKVLLGFFQSLMFLLKKRPDILFSKGGFVSVPVALAAWILKIPVISHESDITPGLANKVIALFATKILCSFPETTRYLRNKNSFYVGSVVRQELFDGTKDVALSLCGFSKEDHPSVILVIGGSSGALRINDALLTTLPDLVKRFRVIHITGKGKGIDFAHPRYKAFDYVRDELKDLFALADFIVARSGSNSIFEFLALRKPMLLIPLEIGSRGDQVLNALSFSEKGWAHILRETALTKDSLLREINHLVENAASIRTQQQKFTVEDVCTKIFAHIEEVLKV